ncbi:MAG TPA: XF1762 family protein [Anaeromyxobacteraceae bacterium]|nr:XF1762 family protein [Anaeromyxobacteraceae bacterium]
MSLELVPVTLRDAHAFIERLHRHHKPSRGGKFAIGVARGEELVGVAVVGRPVARGFDDGFTAEVTRVATDGSKNACSMLYGAAWRAAKAMGYRKCITYTLSSEPGTSLRAAGWRIVGEVKGRSWDTPSRPRVDAHPLQNKLRWETD